MNRLFKVIFVSALAASASSAAVAQERIQVGVLECFGSTSSFVIGSVTDLSCTFRPSSGGPGEAYHAVMRRAGLDIGINQRVSVAWAVFAPTRGFGRGYLAGNYGGAAASATVGVGVGANALVGGSNNTIALQPLSLQGQTGLSIAAGVAGLELRPGP
jgi:hypothetical protein